MDTTAFLTRVRQTTQIAATDEDWTDAEILREASQCLFERFSQPVVQTRSGYWLMKQTTSTVAGQAFYRIPPRAVVQGLELFCTTAPNATTQWYQLGVLTSTQSVPYQDQQLNQPPQAFGFESDGIVLYPTPQQSTSLQYRFYLRPGQLVSVPTYGVLLDATSTQLVIEVVDTYPWDTGSLIDLRNLNGTCEAVAIDLVVDAVAEPVGGSATVSLSTPLTDEQLSRLRFDGTQAAMTADTSWVVPLPAEMVSALVAYTAAVVLVDKGDTEKAQAIVSRCEAVVATAVELMNPRVRTKPFVFKTRNSYLRRHAGTWNGWR